MAETKVATSADVREGQLHSVQLAGKTLLLTRVQGQVSAFSSKCPHVGLSLAKGAVVDGTVQCPFHGSRFDLRNGQNLDWTHTVGKMEMPKWSHAVLAMGKKPAPLVMFPALERDGAVFVTAAA